jgi:AraC family transcriptional regulator, transcriptional activator of pobA
MNFKTKPIPLHGIETKEIGRSGFGIINLIGDAGKNYDSSVPHRHAFFELLVFKQAKGTHEIDFNNHPIENNTVHFVSPGQIHKLTLKKKQGYVLCFTEDFVSLKSKGRFIESFPFYDNLNHPILKLSKELSVQLNELIVAIKSELQTSNADNMEICRAYLDIILLKLKSCFQKVTNDFRPGTTAKHQKIEQYKKLINENYLLHKTVSNYADKLSLTPNHLNALCKKQEGKTAIQFIHERLLLESKRLLYATDMQIKEISFYLNFEDVPYFNRFFKRHVGIKPLEYRMSSQKNR